MFIWIRVHLRNPINVRQIELLAICLYSGGSEDRFVVVQHFWCRKICQIVCRISRKWMESKFLDQDVDVVSLANKGIVIGCFFSRNYNKIFMETGKLTGTSGSQKWTRIWCWQNVSVVGFCVLPIDLIHSERVSSSTSFFYPIVWHTRHMHPWYWWALRIVREKGRDLTQSYDKSP